MESYRDRQEYKWRPNDNSSSTRLKYDLEAEHIVQAYKSAYRKQQSVSIGQSVSVIGIVISLIASLVVLVVMGLVGFVRWVRS